MGKDIEVEEIQTVPIVAAAAGPSKKPFEWTPARKEAFEKCIQARNIALTKKKEAAAAEVKEDSNCAAGEKPPLPKKARKQKQTALPFTPASSTPPPPPPVAAASRPPPLLGKVKMPPVEEEDSEEEESEDEIAAAFPVKKRSKILTKQHIRAEIEKVLQQYTASKTTQAKPPSKKRDRYEVLMSDVSVSASSEEEEEESNDSESENESSSSEEEIVSKKYRSVKKQRLASHGKSSSSRYHQHMPKSRTVSSGGMQYILI